MARDVERGMKIESAVLEFLDDRRRRGKRPRTVENYRQDLQYLVDFMKKKRVVFYNDMERLHVREFVDWLNATPWKEASKQKRLRSVKAFFNWVDQDEDCQDLDMRSHAKILPKIKKTILKTWIPTPQDIKEFLEGFSLSSMMGLRDYTAASLMIDTGMRIGELCHLKLVNLDKLSDKMIMVPEEGKTGWRIVQPTQDMVKDLKRWLHRRESYLHRIGVECEYVFITKQGKQMSVGAFELGFARNRIRLGVNGEKNITPHMLRHFFCTNWIRQGGDLATLQSMTGHTQLQTLQGYLHLVGDISVGQMNERVSARKAVLNAGKPHRGRKRLEIAV